MADVLLGDRKAIAVFIDRYSDAVFAFISRRMDDRAAIEDVCQEVFLVAWSQLSAFQANASLKTWLCAIAQNKVADFYRRQIRELPLEEEWEWRDAISLNAPWVGVEQEFDQRLLDQRIRLTMLQLPEGYRAMLRWRYWDERPLREIASQTGKTIKSVERILARARLAFAAKWKEGHRGKEA